MKEHLTLKTEKELRAFYDKWFERGTSLSSPRYNTHMLDYLQVPVDKTRSLLDVACGGGWLLLEAERRANCVGIDISSTAIKDARTRLRSSEVLVGSGEKLPFKDEYFDYVTCLGSLEHFLNMDNGLSEIRRVMKRDALANIYLPNLKYYLAIYLKFVKKIDITHAQLNERFGTKDEWIEQIEKNGLRVIKTIGYTKITLKHIAERFWQRRFAEAFLMFAAPLTPLEFAYSFVFICKKKIHHSPIGNRQSAIARIPISECRIPRER